VEIICPVNIKETLRLGDGDGVTITLGTPKGT
jgi:CTP-dependent riboflavin kinase